MKKHIITFVLNSFTCVFCASVVKFNIEKVDVYMNKKITKFLFLILFIINIAIIKVEAEEDTIIVDECGRTIKYTFFHLGFGESGDLKNYNGKGEISLNVYGLDEHTLVAAEKVDRANSYDTWTPNIVRAEFILYVNYGDIYLRHKSGTLTNISEAKELLFGLFKKINAGVTSGDGTDLLDEGIFDHWNIDNAEELYSKLEEMFLIRTHQSYNSGRVSGPITALGNNYMPSLYSKYTGHDRFSYYNNNEGEQFSNYLVDFLTKSIYNHESTISEKIKIGLGSADNTFMVSRDFNGVTLPANGNYKVDFIKTKITYKKNRCLSEIEYRNIDSTSNDPKKIFSGALGGGRKIGSNWCKREECTSNSPTAGSDINLEPILYGINSYGIKPIDGTTYKPKYTIILNSITIGEIRKYNKNTTYDDFNMVCDAVTNYCKSSFLENALIWNSNNLEIIYEEVDRRK